MPANKTLTSAQNHLTGMARSHKEPTAPWRIIWTSANPDPVGAGHACEQGSHFGAESFTGMARSHQKLTAQPTEGSNELQQPPRHCIRRRIERRLAPQYQVRQQLTGRRCQHQPVTEMPAVEPKPLVSRDLSYI